jgi:spore coat protein U-like protein
MTIRNIVGLFLSTCSISGLADASNSVKFNMSLEVDGTVVSRPQATLNFGEKGAVTQTVKNGDSSYTIEVTPTMGAKNEVLMTFAVKRTRNGETTLLSSPKVATLSGETATVEQKAQGMPALKLTVTPTL